MDIYLHLFTVIIVMIVAGCFGGLVNFFYSVDEKATKTKSIILGLGASFLVPLFLNMISSSLLADSEKDPYKVLVFMGFCLIAAISSKAFIDTISDKIMKVAQDAKNTAQNAENTASEAKEQVQKVKEVVDPIASKETEQDPVEENTDEIELPQSESNEIVDKRAGCRIHKSQSHDTESIGEKEKAILNTLNEGKYTYRTLASLSHVLGMSSPATIHLLLRLESLGFVGRLSKNNWSHYYLSAQGRKLISTFNYSCEENKPT